MELKFKIGDKVKVVNKDLDAFGAIGEIVDIDKEWHVPYEVSFGEKKYNEEIFYETDLILVDEEDNVVIEEEPIEELVEDEIDILVEKLRAMNPSREISLAITHLQEAQNWLYRLKRK